MRFTDEAFIDAIGNTNPQRGQVSKIAALVGCSEATAIKRCRKLAATDGSQFEVVPRHTYDKQSDGWGQGLFGGAGVCIRRFLVIQFTDFDRRMAQREAK